MPDQTMSVSRLAEPGVYVPPFDALRRSAEVSSVRGELRVALSYDAFVAVVRTLVAAIPVDEAFYLRTYADVAQAIRDGSVTSARQHYVDDGYLEGRLPSDPAFDEAYYLDAHPDVAEQVRTGRLPSARFHYVMDGYREGRRPHA